MWRENRERLAEDGREGDKMEMRHVLGQIKWCGMCKMIIFEKNLQDTPARREIYKQA